ncbi:MAG TPA: PAS domain S-box protein, partial [Anaeromyxobacteraceae bacterium]|nr:PAS domain S-box protein [Anaeromyxobacteraceae bacterium]
MPSAVFVALAAGTCYAAQQHVRGFERDLRQQVERELSAVADLRVAQVIEWRRSLLEEAGDLVEGPGRLRELEALLARRGSPDDASSLALALERRVRREKLEAASLVDRAGEPVVSSAPGREVLPGQRAALEDARRAGRAILVDLPGKDEDLLAVAPVFSEKGEFLGGVLLAAHVREALPALLQEWPAPSPSAEAYLGLVAGGEVQAVSLMRPKSRERGVPSASLKEAVPLAMAARGEVGVGPARDGRGVKVIAARRTVAGSPWVIVTSVDEAELLAPAAERARSLGVAVGGLLLAAAVALFAWWRGLVASLARRRRELDERALQQRLEFLWKNANDIVVLTAADGSILDANDRALEAYGYTREELRALRGMELRSPEMQPEYAADLARLHAEGALRFETVHRRKDGSTFPVEVSARIFTLDRQQLVYATARDITDRRRAEQAARLQASLLSRLNDAVVAVDREGRVTAWTGAAARIYGRSAEEALGRPVSEVFGALPEDVPRTGKARRTMRSECVHRAKDGTRLDIEMTTVALRDESGRTVGSLSVNRDVTEQKRAERALRQHQERLQLALEVTEVGICDVDLRSGEAHLSPRLMAMLGREAPAARIEEVLATVHPSDASRYLTQYQDLIAGRIERFDSEYRTMVAGGTFWHRAHARVIERDPAGRAVRMVTTVADITEERRLQAQLVFADRLASIGTLAAGVAHEINNPLSYLLANFEFLEERLGERHDGPDAQALEAVREARDGARRIAEIVRGLRVFSQA